MDRRYFLHSFCTLAAGIAVSPPSLASTQSGAQTATQIAYCPRIELIGVGGAGSDLVRQLIDEGIEGVSKFICIDTDSSVLAISRTDHNKPFGVGQRGNGRRRESLQGTPDSAEFRVRINDALSQADTVIVVAGMGGTAGSAFAPVVAHLARRSGAQVMAVLITPPTSLTATARASVELAQSHSHASIVVSGVAIAASLGADPSLPEIFQATSRAALTSIRTLVAMNYGALGAKPHEPKATIESRARTYRSCMEALDRRLAGLSLRATGVGNQAVEMQTSIYGRDGARTAGILANNAIEELPISARDWLLTDLDDLHHEFLKLGKSAEGTTEFAAVRVFVAEGVDALGKLEQSVIRLAGRPNDLGVRHFPPDGASRFDRQRGLFWGAKEWL